MEARVLTVNGGSSSIKFAVYAAGESPRRVLAGAVERVGLPDSFLRVSRPGGPDERLSRPAADPDRAAAALLEWLEGAGELGRVAAVGHRVVHGGVKYASPVRIDDAVLAELDALVPLAPL
ncbi:MAG: acetate/propionate family kinase, partial [Gemmataceae bacterium]|nr:acetate/propionate family kinase [Gemmataceae bacterium]